MSEVGYVRLYRTLLGHHAFRNDAEAMAFAWMVMRAAWRPTRVRYKERIIDIDRGQLAVSIRDMAAAMDRDKAWVERLWKRLKSETMIETVTVAGVSIVTIYKYNEFQSPADTAKAGRETPGKIRARQGQDTEQRREEGKKEEKEESTPIAPTDAELAATAAQAVLDAEIAAAEKAAAAAKPKPAKARAKAVAQIPSAPDWVDPEAWTAFIEMRCKKGKCPTDRAIELLIVKLTNFRDAGQNAASVLNQSTVNNWTDLYLVKEENSAGSNDNRPRNNRGEGDGFTRALGRARAALPD